MSTQEVITALAKAARVSELAAAAALAIEETPEFRLMYLPVRDGGYLPVLDRDVHPAAVSFALAALKGAGIES
jgi:hypothetical protein